MTLTSAENRHNTFTDVLLMAGILFTFLYRIIEMLWLPNLDAASQYLPTLWGLLAGALAVRGQAFRRSAGDRGYAHQQFCRSDCGSYGVLPHGV